MLKKNQKNNPTQHASQTKYVGIRQAHRSHLQGLGQKEKWRPRLICLNIEKV